MYRSGYHKELAREMVEADSPKSSSWDTGGPTEFVV